MERIFRKRLLLGHASIVLVIVLSTVTAFVALRSMIARTEQTTTISQRIAALDDLRADAREIVRSARRFLLSGDYGEQQRVVAIEAEMRQKRVPLVAHDKHLDDTLDGYTGLVLASLTRSRAEPAAMLAQFEDDLMRVRGPLSTAFDDAITRERAKHDASRSSQRLARGAQWALIVAAALGVLLTIGSMLAVNVLLGRKADRTGLSEATADVSLRRDPCDVAALVDRAIRSQREAAKARGIQLRFESHLALTVSADRERIRLVLASLLGHAITAAPDGAEIVMSAAPTDDGVRFMIADAGATVPTPSVFEPAVAAPPDDLRLQLSQRVIEAHGGRLGIETATAGSTYWFTLPTEPRMLT